MSKQITVLISGAPADRNLHDLELQPGSSVRDVLRAVGLNEREYLLSLEGSAQTLASEESVYDLVRDGGKVRAAPISEVGRYAA